MLPISLTLVLTRNSIEIKEFWEKRMLFLQAHPSDVA